MNKRKLGAIGASIVVATVAGAAPALAADVGVSVHISQPGIYGRVDIGQFPQPQVVVAQPVIIQPRPVTVVQQPVYMWVPPGHRQDWRRYCGGYNACGVPVYFVQDQWYEQHVHPHGKNKDKHKNKHKDNHPGKGHGSKGKHDD